MDDKSLVTNIPSEDMPTIDLLEVFHVLWRKLWALLLFTLLGGALAGGFTYFFIAPKYDATATLYVVSASNDSVVNLTDLQLGSSLTKDYEALVLSRPMLESVLQNTGLSTLMDYEELRDMITIANPINTRILQITVRNENPARAMNIANEMAHLATTWLPEIMESNAPNIAEEAIIPQKKASPSYTIATIIGALIFLVLSASWILLKHYSNDTIRSPEELERYFGLTPLSIILEERGAKVKKTRKIKRRQEILSGSKWMVK